MPEKYIGSLLSLVSKSEIRYEGTLCTVDVLESSIALSDVRSFGTEDRPVEKPVGPRSELFEYIIFRASDIKTLEVIKRPSEVEFEDPAIIKARANYIPKPSIDPSGISFGSGVESTNAPPTSISSTFRINAPANVRPAPSMPMSLDVVESQVSQNSLTSGPPAAGPAFGATVDFRSANSTPTQWARRSPASDVGIHTPPVDKTVKDKTQPHADHINPRDTRDARNQNMSHNVDSMQNHSGVRGFDRRMNAPPVHNQRRSVPHPNTPMRPPMPPMSIRGGRQGIVGATHKKGGPNAFNRLPPQHQPRRTSHFNRGQTNRKQESTALKISDDYDFEKANKEFEELENKFSKAKIDEPKLKENGDQEVEQTNTKDEPFYDKKKSFFDKISCEAIERSKGKVNRVDWRKERKINVETFGSSANFRRGGYRGRGGGYGSYGGNYRQNYNNRRGGDSGARFRNDKE